MTLTIGIFRTFLSSKIIFPREVLQIPAVIIDLTSGFGRRAGEAALAAQFRDSLKKKIRTYKEARTEF